MRRTSEQLKEESKQYKVYQEGDKWVGFRICPECKKEIKHTAGESFLILRNIRNSIKENTSCLSCAMTGEGNSFFGRTHSEKTKIQVSKSRTGKACGEGNSMANPENRNKVSVRLKEEYDSGRLDFLKEIQRNNIVNGHKEGRYISKPVSIKEKEIKEVFENLGYKTKSQFPINTLRYDLFLEEYNTLIEYNGDYWHCNPEKYDKNYFNQKKNKFAYELWENDKNKKELAIKNGYKFFVIWEKNFNKNSQEEINKIISQL